MTDAEQALNAIKMEMVASQTSMQSKQWNSDNELEEALMSETCDIVSCHVSGLNEVGRSVVASLALAWVIGLAS